jgi:hypothetical protein
MKGCDMYTIAAEINFSLRKRKKWALECAAPKIVLLQAPT